MRAPMHDPVAPALSLTTLVFATYAWFHSSINQDAVDSFSKNCLVPQLCECGMRTMRFVLPIVRFSRPSSTTLPGAQEGVEVNTDHGETNIELQSVHRRGTRKKSLACQHEAPPSNPFSERNSYCN